MKNGKRIISFVPNVKCIRCRQAIKAGESFQKQVSPDKVYSVYRHTPKCPTLARARMLKAE